MPQRKNQKIWYTYVYVTPPISSRRYTKTPFAVRLPNSITKRVATRQEVKTLVDNYMQTYPIPHMVIRWRDAQQWS